MMPACLWIVGYVTACCGMPYDSIASVTQSQSMIDGWLTLTEKIKTSKIYYSISAKCHPPPPSVNCLTQGAFGGCHCRVCDVTQTLQYGQPAHRHAFMSDLLTQERWMNARPSCPVAVGNIWEEKRWMTGDECFSNSFCPRRILRAQTMI